MKVRIPDPMEESIVGEMVDTDELEVGFIAEMVTDPAKLASFGFSAAVQSKAKALAEAVGDDSPEFPVIRVEEGWSGSGRLWTANTLDSIAEQTNATEPVGHLGHIPDAEAGTSFPDPQTTWVGALVKDEPSQNKVTLGKQVHVVYFAGYNLPGAKVRQFIKTKAVRGISWWGRGDLVKVPGKGVEVKNFTLKALDWARKNSEGMPTSRIVAMAREQEDHGMDKDLAQVTPDEFKTANPNGYALLVSEVVAEKDAKIGEMETQITELEADRNLLADVRKALKLPEDGDVLATIADAMQKLGVKAKEALNKALDVVLAERVPDEEKRALVKRLLPIGEMESKLEDAKPEDAEKVVGEMVDAEFDKDETIKTIVSEMTPPAVRRREDLRGSDSNLDTALGKFGVKRERVTLGA